MIVFPIYFYLFTFDYSVEKKDQPRGVSLTPALISPGE